MHAYGVPDVTPPDLDGGQVHTFQADEIADIWFVLIDGGREETQKTARIPEESTGGTFYGVWTYVALGRVDPKDLA